MEGMEIPIGGDLSGLQEAFAAVIAAVDRMGNQIVAALEKSNAAMVRSQAAMTGMQHGAAAAASAQQKAAGASTTLAGSMGRVITNVSRAGQTLSGLHLGFNAVNAASRALTGVNIAASFSGWISKAGGLRAALAKIPAAMAAVASNPTFKKIVIGAAAAVAGVIAIRVAWRTAAASASILTSAASAVFRGIVAGAHKAASTIAATFRGIASAPGKLIGSIPGLPLAGILSGAAATALLVTQLKAASESAAGFEDMRVSFEQFTGSAETANKMLNDLQQFSIKTPFTTTDIQTTTEGLLGAGVREDVVGITKDLAAMARNGEELKGLGDALGKGFAKGKFQTEQMNMFLERGINLNPALQAQLGLTGEAFQKAVEDGLGFGTVTAAIRSMSAAGGQFYGWLDKRAGTFNGLISTMESAWTDIRKAFATPINDALKPVLQSGIDGIVSLMAKAKELGQSIAGGISALFGVFEIGKSTALLKAGLELAIRSSMDLLQRGFRGAVAFIATALPPVIAAAFAKLQDKRFWTGLSQMVAGIGQSIAVEIRSAFPGADQKQMALDQQGASLNMEAGGLQMDLAGKINLPEVIKRALMDAQQAASKAMSGASSPELIAAKDLVNELLEAGRRRVQAEKDADEIFGNLLNGPGSKIIPQSSQAVVEKAITPAVMSMARFGGGGGSMSVFGNLLSENKKQTNYQRQLVELLKPGKPSVASFA